jgi:N-acetylmuramoyl-L-alanine amidase
LLISRIARHVWLIMVSIWRHTSAALAAIGVLAATGPVGDAVAATRKAVSQSEPSCNRAEFRVLLDVGHTAEEPGAISVRSVSEYEFNLRLARRIERALTEAGFAKTILQVTSGTTRSTLVKRVVDANATQADLLISIHHDSVPDWLLQHMDEEGGPKRFSDRFRGHSIFVSHENADPAGSLEFAKTLGRQLKEAGLNFTPHYTEQIMRERRRELLDKDAGVYRFDALYVLRATRMPAVLFEAGLIINPAEETVLTGEARQKAVAVAMTQAVEKFCASRAPSTATTARKRK